MQAVATVVQGPHDTAQPTAMCWAGSTKAAQNAHRTVVVLLEASIRLRSSSILLSHFLLFCCCPLRQGCRRAAKRYVTHLMVANVAYKRQMLHCMQRIRQLWVTPLI